VREGREVASAPAFGDWAFQSLNWQFLRDQHRNRYDMWQNFSASSNRRSGLKLLYGDVKSALSKGSILQNSYRRKA